MYKLQLSQEESNVIYIFTPDGEYNSKTKWKRLDKDVIIVFIDHIGWCVLDEDVSQVGWPFNEIQNLKATNPPEGKWLSWKKGKSYIYNLTIVEE